MHIYIYIYIYIYMYIYTHTHIYMYIYIPGARPAPHHRAGEAGLETKYQRSLIIRSLLDNKTTCLYRPYYQVL